MTPGTATQPSRCSLNHTCIIHSVSSSAAGSDGARAASVLAARTQTPPWMWDCCMHRACCVASSRSAQQPVRMCVLAVMSSQFDTLNVNLRPSHENQHSWGWCIVVNCTAGVCSPQLNCVQRQHYLHVNVNVNTHGGKAGGDDSSHLGQVQPTCCLAVCQASDRGVSAGAHGCCIFA